MRPARIIFLVIAVTLSSLLPGAESQRKLLPVDEAAKNPSFFLFRSKLQEAVARKDAAYLLSVIAPDIQTGFDGEDGNAAFKKKWSLEKPEDSQLWPVLARVLAMGGKFNTDDAFLAPYTSAAWPEDLDPFEHVAVIGENVRVREKPEANSAVVATLSYDVIQLVETSSQVGKGPWVKVKLANGREGYVSEEFLSLAIPCRAYFEKKDGVWKMTALVAGD